MSESIKNKLNEKQSVFISEETGLLDPNKIWDVLTSSQKTLIKKHYNASDINEHIHNIGDIVGLFNEEVQNMDAGISFMRKVKKHKEQQKANDVIQNAKADNSTTQTQELPTHEPTQSIETEEVVEKEIPVVKTEILEDPITSSEKVAEEPQKTIPVEQGIIIDEDVSSQKEIVLEPISEVTEHNDELKDVTSKFEEKLKENDDEFEIVRDTKVSETVKDVEEIEVVETVEKAEEIVEIKKDEAQVIQKPVVEAPEVLVEKSISDTLFEKENEEPETPIVTTLHADAKKSKERFDRLNKKGSLQEDSSLFDESKFIEVKEVLKEEGISIKETTEPVETSFKEELDVKKDFDSEFKEVKTRKVDESFQLVKIKDDKSNQGSLALFVMLLKSTSENAKKGGRK